MKLTKYPYNSIRELEDYLLNTYQKYIILREEGKEIYRCFILSFHKEFNIGIGLAVSCLSSPQKKYWYLMIKIFLIRFDSVVFCISIQNIPTQPSVCLTQHATKRPYHQCFCILSHVFTRYSYAQAVWKLPEYPIPFTIPVIKIHFSTPLSC